LDWYNVTFKQLDVAICLLSVKFSIELEICAFVDTEVSNGKTGGKAAVQSVVKKPTDKVVDVKEAMRIDSILAGVLRKVSLMALEHPQVIIGFILLQGACSRERVFSRTQISNNIAADIEMGLMWFAVATSSCSSCTTHCGSKCSSRDGGKPSTCDNSFKRWRCGTSTARRQQAIYNCGAKCKETED